MSRFPKNPFEAGIGGTAPWRAPRPEAEDVLSGFVDALRGDRPDGQLAIVRGPRGNGKTTLLRWLEDRVQAAGVAAVPLLPEDLESADALTGAIRSAGKRFRKPGRWVSAIRTEVGVAFGAAAADRRLPSFANLFGTGEGGVLVTLDEAQEVPPKILNYLLNAMQHAGARRPLALVLAGTPGLGAALRASRASFWSRGRKLFLGLLPEADAREALARPFRDAGLGVDDAAIAGLAAAADNYPWFLQRYGEVAWRVVEASGGRSLRPEHVAPTLAEAEAVRQECFRERYDEFDAAGLLPLARRVAEALVASAEAPADRRLEEAELCRLLSYEGSYEHRRFLEATDYVWRDRLGELTWAPGIPGLADYMIAHVAAP